MGGSSKKTVGYRYYAGMHMAMCHGPIDNISEIRVDDKTLWAGTTAGGRITIDKPDIFGGDSREGGITGEVDIEMGEATQGQNDYLVSVLGSLVPSFRGVACAVLRQVNLSMNPYIKAWSFRAQRIHTQQSGELQWQDAYAQINVPVFDEEGNATTAAAMNPAHIIRECLTNVLWGMGYAEGDIDDVTFLSAAIKMHDEKMGMSLLWDTQTSIEEFIKIVLQHIDASLYVDRKTGKFTLKLIRADYDENTLLVFNENNVDKIDDFKRPVFGELANGVTVNYWGFTEDQTATLTVQDIALSQEQGGDNHTTVTYEGFIDAETASKAAQRDLRSLSTPLISCTIYATKFGRELNIGDVFVLEWPDYQIDRVVMRVTGIAYGDGKTRRVRINCAQDVFAYPEDAFVVRPVSGWADPRTAPGAARYLLGYEAPYYELVKDAGQSVVDSSLEANPYVGYVGVSASAPIEPSIAGVVYSDAGSGFEEVSQLDFCAGARLAEDVGLEQVEFEIEDVVSNALIEVGTWFQVDQELMSVVSLVGTTLTVNRAVLDTIPKEHSTGAVALFWEDFAELDPTEYVASDEVSVKVTPINGSGVYPLADATSQLVTLVGRAAKPFPAHNLRLDGVNFPEALPENVINATWVTRNRILQTGGTLLGYFDASITTEPGVTYTATLTALDENKVDISVLDTEDVADATSYTFDFSELVPANCVYVRLDVVSFRDGLSNFQTATVTTLIDALKAPENMTLTNMQPEPPANMTLEEL